MPDLLDDIGSVLTDYEASRDAMRWAPERVICDGGKLLHIRSRCPPVSTTADVTQFMTAMTTAMTEAANALGRAVMPAVRSLASALSAMAAQADTSPEWHALMYPRQHRRRCRVCNPWGNPPPEAGKYQPGPKAARMRGRRK